MNERGCWVYNGESYPSVDFRGGSVGLHRLSCAAFNNAVPEGYVVLHLCDDPRCVNPHHLRSGTHEENMADMREKSRTVRVRERIGHIIDLEEL